MFYLNVNRAKFEMRGRLILFSACLFMVFIYRMLQKVGVFDRLCLLLLWFNLSSIDLRFILISQSSAVLLNVLSLGCYFWPSVCSDWTGIKILLFLFSH